MEWMESLRKSIEYMEGHLEDDISADEVAKEVCMSSFYLQKGFGIMTGYTIGEYLRNRRLYLAALDLIADRGKVIDIAFKYGYDTPESFTKAFTRFHGVSPMQLKKDSTQIRTFLPLKITISIQGGNNMDYSVEKMNGFRVAGFEREFSYENAYEEIPKFWDEIMGKYVMPLFNKEAPETDMEKFICDTMFGMFGVNIDDLPDRSKFRYMIAGEYHGETVPEGMKVFEFPDMEWAKFRCVGPMPGALQSVNTRIFKEWLPGNPDYDIAFGASIEWYDKGDPSAADYETGIWLPVKSK